MVYPLTPVAASIADYRNLARRRIPGVVFDFLEGGAGADAGVVENRAAFARQRFFPRVLCELPEIDISAKLWDRSWQCPFGVAPMGLAGFVWPGADKILAETAKEFGIPFCLSTASTTSIEDISKILPDQTWFQLYPLEDDRIEADLIERCDDCGVEVLVVTVDSPLTARRQRDIRNGLILPLRASTGLIFDILRRPTWCLETARVGSPTLANMLRYAGSKKDAQTVGKMLQDQLLLSMNWKNIEKIRQKWPGKLVVKGIINPDDAKMSKDLGADAIVVSNHGGRQLESSVSSLEALPWIRREVGAEFPVLFDGGICSGEDIAKAIAAGASFVLIGRAMMYGVAAARNAGVRSVVQMLMDELKRTMAQLGQADIRKLQMNGDMLFNPKP